MKFKSIEFTQAYLPNYILGQTVKFGVVDRETETRYNQKFDVRMTYFCNNEWLVQAKNEPTVFKEEDIPGLIVNPSTCEPINPKPTVEPAANTTASATSDTTTWGRLTVTLFSVLVSSSILAAYSPSTFYGTIVYLAGSAIRPIFLFGTWKGWIYECTNPDPIIKIVEACYMKRHEEDLVGEEEAFRMLQEIVRSPELFKALTGSSLKGATDPLLDKLSDKDKQKLEHLTKLEAKGFEVQDLKNNIMGKTNTKAGENLS